MGAVYAVLEGVLMKGKDMAARTRRTGKVERKPESGAMPLSGRKNLTRNAVATLEGGLQNTDLPAHRTMMDLADYVLCRIYKCAPRDLTPWCSAVLQVSTEIQRAINHQQAIASPSRQRSSHDPGGFISVKRRKANEVGARAIRLLCGVPVFTEPGSYVRLRQERTKKAARS